MTEETKSNHETILLSRRRHINYGHQSYENEEFQLCVSAYPTTQDNARAQWEMRDLLNSIEFDARRNHRDMQQKWDEELQEAHRKEIMEVEQRHRDNKDLVFAMVQTRPDVTPSFIEEELDLTGREVAECLDELVEEGKLERRKCQRLFNIVTQDTEHGVPEDPF